MEEIVCIYCGQPIEYLDEIVCVSSDDYLEELYAYQDCYTAIAQAHTN